MRRRNLLIGSIALILALVPALVYVVNTTGRTGLDLSGCTGKEPEACVVQQTLAYAVRTDVRTAVTAVKLSVKANPILLNGCHRLTHEIGEAFWNRFGKAAVVKDSRWCSYGYLHGLMVAVGKKDASVLVGQGLEICTTVEGRVTRGCVHGIGHAAFQVANDLMESIDYCKQLDDTFMESNCASGVLMEMAMSNPEDRLPDWVDGHTCTALADEGLISGCAVVVSTDLVVRGNALDGACSMFTSGLGIWGCRYGFGAALANSYLGGFRSPAEDDQRRGCAPDWGCAEGFGMAARLYTESPTKASQLCADLLGKEAVVACQYGIDRTDKFASKLW